MSQSQELAAALSVVHATAARLPSCDRAAHLHALLMRMSGVMDATFADCATQLAVAAAAALDDDPWVQFEAAARRLRETAQAIASPHAPTSSTASC